MIAPKRAGISAGPDFRSTVADHGELRPVDPEFVDLFGNAIGIAVGKIEEDVDAGLLLGRSLARWTSGDIELRVFRIFGRLELLRPLPQTRNHGVGKLFGPDLFAARAFLIYVVCMDAVFNGPQPGVVRAL